MSLWSINADFISKGIGQFENEKIKWTLTRRNSIGFLISCFTCEMQAFGKTETGWGEALSSKLAITKAFCEAWERVWASHNNHDTNGYAAGRDENDAQNRARSELIERAVFLQAWQSQKGCHLYQPKSLKFKLLSPLIEKDDWQLQFYQIKNNLGPVLTLLATHPKQGIEFDVVYADRDLAGAEIKLLFSIGRAIQYRGDPEPLEKLTEENDPILHRRFYAHLDHLQAFDFLSDSQGEIVLANPEQIQTQTIVDASEFPAVVRANHSSWPKLSWGLKSIQGENQWPHPLV